ncbi:aspartate aminotransferase family protein [Gayadomonas joobiniege]|uniref:aspartate aminotransferase family protein n=1 Tax=Gayadomonas joobiniege TaxID=1234606 RepID=UPI00037E30AC|nr:aminotransferase class III-fold pyridoxal phosphate-dependent enzyme [Gayadomonas joobiniege]
MLPNNTVKNFSILEQNAFSDQKILTDPYLKKLITERQQSTGPMSVLFYQQPLNLVRGEGVWLFDHQGKKYLDVYNNVQSVGHANTKVADAIHQQFLQINCHSRYLNKGLHEYSNRLLATLPGTIDRLVMTCTGSEANDLALRLAKDFTGHQGIIVTKCAYHGNTQAVSAVSPSSMRSSHLDESVQTINIAQIAAASDPADAFLQQIKQAKQRLQASGYGCAALLIDSIFSSDGVYAEPAGFIKAGIDYLQNAGTLFIADEVQPGFGRVGHSMWGFNMHQVIPDIVTMGKPMGNGYPVAALATREELLQGYNNKQGYFNTFGGSNAAVAAATAVLDEIINRDLINNAKTLGFKLKQTLIERLAGYAFVKEIRGAGFFLGIEICQPNNENIAAPSLATKIVNLLKEEQVLIGTAGDNGSSLKLRPQLCFSPDHVTFLVAKMEAVFAQIAGELK